MKFKRVIAPALALSLVVAACGGDDDDTTATTSGGTETTADGSVPTETAPDDATTETTEPASTDGSATTAPSESTVPEEEQTPIDPAREIRLLAVSPPPTSWDPATTTNGITQVVRFYNAVYDTLLRVDGDNQLAPLLATDWEYDDSNTVLTLTLRDDVTFSDGATFDAEVAKLNLERVMAGTSQMAQLLAGIESIEAASPTELVITQAEPNVKTLWALSSPASSMISPDALAGDLTALLSQPVGSGPYLLEKVDTASATFVRNDDYWDADLVVPARQILTSAIDPNARINAMLTGQVDVSQISQAAPTPDLVAKADAGELQLITVHGMPTSVAMNTSIPPLDNPKVVQAINLATDREQINDLVYGGLCEPISQLFVEEYAGHIDGLEYEHDVEKAKQLMAEAGVGPVTIQYQGVAGSPTLFVELYSAMLAEIGITLDVVLSPAPVVATNFYAGQFAMSAGSFFLAAPDPAFVTDYITGQFNPGNKPDELVELVNEANALAYDDPARDAAYQAVNQYVFDNPINVPLCRQPNNIAAAADVVGLESIPMANIGNMDTSRMGMAAAS